MSIFLPVFEQLRRGEVRAVVVGGVAVVLHGFARLTGDLDLCVDLDPEEARKAVRALVDIGLHPRVPVDPFDFADPGIRGKWVTGKGMKVFSLCDPANPLRSVDLLVEEIIPFGDLWARSEAVTIGAVEIRVASIPDLIALKRVAARPRDLEDIRALESILATKR
jgi:hypothetical protein